MKRLAPMLGLLALMNGAVHADELPPHWAAEFKLGPFHPATKDWSRYYPDSPTYVEAGVAWMPWRQVELGLNAGYLSTTGKGIAPLHGAVTGNVGYELYPIHAAVVWRGLFSDGQWLVPYAGGGWTRIYYRESVQYQSDITGSADGYHVRGGLQLLLDRIDIRGASNIRGSGVQHTWFFLEYQRTDVSKSGVQLGGSAVLGGFQLEF